MKTYEQGVADERARWIEAARARIEQHKRLAKGHRSVDDMRRHQRSAAAGLESLLRAFTTYPQPGDVAREVGSE